MRNRLNTLLAIGAAATIAAGLGACGGSTAKSANEPRTTQIEAQLASSHHAVGDLVDACLHVDTHAVEQHTVSSLHDQPWATDCQAVHDHHLKLVSEHVTTHGDSMTARVVLRTTDAHPRTFNETWHFEYRQGHGWELAQMPVMMQGGWDHDQHVWGTTPTSNASGHTSTTVHHDDGDHHGATTPTTVHHDDGDDH
jgi:hypothetical protein